MQTKRWSIVYKKGYQEFDDVKSAVTTKVKGLGYINNNDTQIKTLNEKMYIVEGDSLRIFDVSLKNQIASPTLV